MRRILIIGATSAIAVACARRWNRDGARFLLVARDAGRLDQVAADLLARNAADVQTFMLDATDLERQASMLEAALAALGQIDVA
jgi:NADP-dependent 3-hydroxy acid dehydrogenase YdfG